MRGALQQASAAGLNVLRTFAHTTDDNFPFQVSKLCTSRDTVASDQSTLAASVCHAFGTAKFHALKPCARGDADKLTLPRFLLPAVKPGRVQREHVQGAGLAAGRGAAARSACGAFLLRQLEVPRWALVLLAVCADGWQIFGAAMGDETAHTCAAMRSWVASLTSDFTQATMLS